MWFCFDIIKQYLYGVMVSLVWEVKFVVEMGKEVYVYFFVYKVNDVKELVGFVNYLFFNSLIQWNVYKDVLVGVLLGFCINFEY